MGELASYSLADFIAYSLDSWYRLLAQYNRALWPAQLVVAPLALVWLARMPAARAAQRSRRGSAIAACALALACLGLGAGFLSRYLAQLSWAGNWLAVGFGLEALLLFGCVAWPGPEPRSNPAVWFGMCLIGYAILVHPLIEFMLLGVPLASIECIGIGPTPSALGLIGWALTRGMRWRLLLVPVPLLWLLFALLTRIGISG